MIINDLFNDMLERPVRELRGRVEFYNGSTLALMCGCHDNLKSFTVERTGESKFFGYGVCHKINIKLIDKDRAINVSTANTAEVVFGVGSNYIYPFPNFYITEVNRDENTNELSITAYDAIYNASKHTVAELGILEGYTIKQFAEACASAIGVPLNEVESAFDIVYENGANFDGTETIREALNAIAEATQTIYFINWDWKLTFKRLDANSAVDYYLTRDKYFNLDSGNNRRLTNITHITELGDNVSASLGVSGTTQYIRNNPFYDLREDIGELLQAAIDRVGGLTINQFNCEWRGNYLLEVGDKLQLTTKDGLAVISYLLNDSISFDGTLSQKTEWSYTDDELESATNPVSIGEALKQTFARVDKVNKQIELVASEAANNAESISRLQLDTDTISASVSRVETEVNTSLDNLNESITTITSQVEAKMSAEDVTIEITKAMENGVSKVETTTGFIFDEEGLTIEKSNREMKTQITEDGMTVYKNEEAVLVANNVGVEARNLEATTYLIIGERSRFENYGNNRTGCFWIGGG